MPGIAPAWLSHLISVSYKIPRRDAGAFPLLECRRGHERWPPATDYGGILAKMLILLNKNM
jgi:hypothetical protein